MKSYYYDLLYCSSVHPVNIIIQMSILCLEMSFNCRTKHICQEKADLSRKDLADSLVVGSSAKWSHLAHQY